MTTEARTALRERPSKASFQADSISVMFSDIPEGITLSEHRRRRCAAAPRPRGLRRAAAVVSWARA